MQPESDLTADATGNGDAFISLAQWRRAADALTLRVLGRRGHE